MATNTPGPSMRVLRSFASIPHAGMQAGQARPVHAGGAIRAGGGRNPIAGAVGSDQEGHLLPPLGRPGTLSGLIGRALDKADISEYNAGVDKDKAKTQAEVQAGVDSYAKLLASTGSPQQALAQVFHPDNEGHVHFNSPAAFQAILQMHQVMAGAQGPSAPQTMDLGHGLIGVQADGKWSVHAAKDLAGGKGVKGPGGAYGTYSTNPETGGLDFHPATVNGEPQAPVAGKVKAATKQEMEQLQDLQTVNENVMKMKNAIGATGSFGWGSINRQLALHSPLGGPQAEAYNQAYNDMAPALVRLSRSPGNAKLFGELALQRLPKPGEATAFLVNQALPSVALQSREQIANLYTSYKAQNSSALPVAENLAKVYEAHPQQMQDIAKARDELQRSPGQMSDHSVAVLQREAARDNLAYDDKLRVMRQMAQRGLIPAEDMPKVAAAHLNFNQIGPEEITAPQFRKPPPSNAAQPAAPANNPVVEGTPAPQTPYGAAVQSDIDKNGPMVPGATAPIPPAQGPPPATAPIPPPGPQSSVGENIMQSILPSAQAGELAPMGSFAPGQPAPPTGQPAQTAQSTAPETVSQAGAQLSPAEAGASAGAPIPPAASAGAPLPPATSAQIPPSPDAAESARAKDVQMLLQETRQLLQATQPQGTEGQ